MIDPSQAEERASQLLEQEGQRLGERRNRWAEFTIGHLRFSELAPYTPMERLKIVHAARIRVGRQMRVIAVTVMLIITMIFIPRAFSPNSYLDWQVGIAVSALLWLAGAWMRMRLLHRAVIAVCKDMPR